MTPPSSKPKRAAKRATPSTRKKADAVRDIPPVGVRLPYDLRERLDAIVEARNARLAAENVGAETSRAALIVAAVREFCDRHQGDASP